MHALVHIFMANEMPRYSKEAEHRLRILDATKLLFQSYFHRLKYFTEISHFIEVIMSLAKTGVI